MSALNKGSSMDMWEGGQLGQQLYVVSLWVCVQLHKGVGGRSQVNLRSWDWCGQALQLQ